jgi:hypothetical protein
MLQLATACGFKAEAVREGLVRISLPLTGGGR